MSATAAGGIAEPLRIGRAHAIVGMLLVAINLRPALASVGPLVGDVRAATALPDPAIGALTTIPLLAFGIVAALTPSVTRRWGIERALVVALLLLAVGTAVRWAPSVPLLFGGTALLGIGIALGNVLLPALVKRDFPERSGLMTSIYSSTMGIGATVAAGVTVPLAAAVGWRGALGAWAIPATVALLAWLPAGRRARHRMPAPATAASLAALAASGLAWQVALFMGFQSLTFYVVLAWLPDLLVSRGASAAEAGWMLALSQAAGIVGSAVVPIWAGRREDQRAVVWILAAIETVALAGLLLPATELAAVWVSLLGVVLGGTFGLSLLFLVARAADTESATALSGAAQAIGYLMAAAGPALFGLLRETTGGWTTPVASLLVVLAAKVAAGLGAARPGVVSTVARSAV